MSAVKRLKPGGINAAPIIGIKNSGIHPLYPVINTGKVFVVSPLGRRDNVIAAAILLFFFF